MTKYPVEVGVVYEGERIRKNDMQVEFGGSAEYKAELCEVKKAGEIQDGKVNVIGMDIDKLPEGSTNNFFIYLKIAGSDLEEDLEGVVERRIHDIFNYIQGVMHLNQREYVWVRIGKESFKAGLRLSHMGAILSEYIKKEFPIIKKAEVDLITDTEQVKKLVDYAVKKYGERNAKVAGMKDEEVDTFYSCNLCKSFASKHLCVISPNRPALCGAINWFDARAASKIDPEGANQPIAKGKVLDADKGEFEGVNKFLDENTGGATKRIDMYSMFDYPHTSCGCFEAVAFYIPELDAVGIVHRGFKGEGVNGLSFSEMASQTGGGEQVVGFLGFGLEWMRSPRFLSADGGFQRVVYLPKELKEKYSNSIPQDVRDKIADETQVKNVKELQEFLEKVDHPWVKKKKPEATEEKKEPEAVQGAPLVLEGAMPGVGGVSITFKNVRIVADKMIIEKKEK
ncbi:MAG: CO dehydrogenase/CO-methylating acetyl-CoA synthase complex subunit beta [Candidatus Altiarchaeota archaeon]|nr:CO dehydrogenase/CO-methylating acetyl-CoA synthase complex subunit beta [Candidatus Altiarchaeota archaeon]